MEETGMRSTMIKLSSSESVQENTNNDKTGKANKFCKNLKEDRHDYIFHQVREICKRTQCWVTTHGSRKLSVNIISLEPTKACLFYSTRRASSLSSKTSSLAKNRMLAPLSSKGSCRTPPSSDGTTATIAFSSQKAI